MSDLRDLYQEVILDHSKTPRNFKALANAECHCDGFNPLCGDKLTVFVNTDGQRITEASFQGTGCAISMASASMMTETLRGKSVIEVEALFKSFQDLVTGGQPDAEVELGKLVIFTGVREFPVRVKCATLPWHTMLAALGKREDTVSTE